MEVNDEVMYHFHRNGIYDDVWSKSEVLVDDDFKSFYFEILDYFNTNVKFFSDRSYPLDRLLDVYLKTDMNTYDKRLLSEAKRIICNANIFKRELALEMVRRAYFNYLPSRKNSICVTDKKGIEYWNSALNVNGNIRLYKVSLSGILFKSSDYFIPDDCLNFDESIKKSFEYWNPDFSLISDDRNEYLFKGTVKIIDRI